MRKRMVGVACVLVVLAACGDGGSGATGVDDHSHEHDHGGDEAATFSFGAPGDPTDASRTVEVVTKDPYRFDPAGIEVEAGETVTFVVTNEGEQDHEFVLGDPGYQDSHGDEMAAGEMHHEGNAVAVAPGETQELTWTFPTGGEILYGCHVQGHYKAGMVGSIDISA